MNVGSIDVDSTALGLDFAQALEKLVRQCDVLLVVIGPRWLDATDQHGHRRLDQLNDFVRIEIAAALNQNKRVIPVLVDEARMPRPDELPEAIRPLATRRTWRLTHERFRTDAQGLVKALQRAFDEVEAERQAQQRLPTSQLAAVGDNEAGRKLKQQRKISLAAFLTGGGAIGIMFIGALFLTLERSVPPPVATEASELSPMIIAKPLLPERERRLRPRDAFKECVTCPEMLVVPAGSFAMGSPTSERGNSFNEGPLHAVRFEHQFAVSRAPVTFDEWDACAGEGGCNRWKPPDQGWGRGPQPVINVSWDDAKAYAAWLSKKTTKPYRLLSEAEHEYITRAGTVTPYWWGHHISTNLANYNGDEYRGRSLPVFSFDPNPWGFFQVHGNVQEYVEDCYHDSYVGAPSDGSPWTSGDCKWRVTRGGSYNSYSVQLRAAHRVGISPGVRGKVFGFRVRRALTP